MEKILQESTLEMLVPNRRIDMKALNEGVLIPVELQEEIIDLAEYASPNYSLITDQLEIDTANARISLSENNRVLNVHEDGRTTKIFLEDFVTYELDKYLKNKFKS